MRSILFSVVLVAAPATIRDACAVCPADPPHDVVEIRAADPQSNKLHHDEMRQKLIDWAGRPNTTIRLGPNVVLDFTGITNSGQPLLQFAACVTLMSVSSFGPGNAPTLLAEGSKFATPTAPAGATSERAQRLESTPPGSADRRPAGNSPLRVGEPIVPRELRVQQPWPIESGRTQQSQGPLLRYGPHRDRNSKEAFLEIRCGTAFGTNDGVRISGIRLYGPSFNQQSVDNVGIRIRQCVDIEISNMEIAGWGGAAIVVQDDLDPPDGTGNRISDPSQVRILHNFIHHNQHPTDSIVRGHATGYGVEVKDGAFAQIRENVFDFNRHAIAAAGDAGGYDAVRNLVLKGGGIHNGLFNKWTHIFDVHGTKDNGFGGTAGERFLFSHNAFQYRNDRAIKIRGVPKERIDIVGNIFAHKGLEDDEGDDAIELEERDFDKIKIGPDNLIGSDSYGRYGVCDFDGDRIDDLFLPTGATWWYSSLGEFQWTFLAARKEQLSQVRLGYFDDDLRCDVLSESDGQWLISSGGSGPWQGIGAFGAPLSEVAFGRFDPTIRDHRPGVTRRTTHVFQRAPNGQWLVSALSAVDFRRVQRSSFPMSGLRFGDFTGDGVTDVLAVVGGRWAISESASSPWRNLNPHLADNVATLYIADLNNNNIDDIIRLQIQTRPGVNDSLKIAYTWLVSDDGRSKWREIRTYAFNYLDRIQLEKSPSVSAFVGRFGEAPGAGVLITDPNRIGHFYSELKITAGVPPNWTSRFPY